MKRLLPLLVFAFVLATALAPAAMADHCRKCNATGVRCVIAVNGGYPFCDDSSGSCQFSGTWCTGPHPFIEEDDPFAADFIVASVERLDEPSQPAPSETRVASLQSVPPAAQR